MMQEQEDVRKRKESQTVHEYLRERILGKAGVVG